LSGRICCLGGTAGTRAHPSRTCAHRDRGPWQKVSGLGLLRAGSRVLILVTGVAPAQTQRPRIRGRRANATSESDDHEDQLR
jgi:hypothetical protein